MGRTLGTVLVVVGVVLLLLSATMMAYASWAEWQHRLQQPPGPRETLPATLDAAATSPVSGEATLAFAPPTEPPTTTAVAMASPSPSTAPAPSPSAAPSPTVAPSPTTAPSPTPEPSYGTPVWMSIPRIGVDSSVMAVGVRNGEYQVPSFDVGFHEDSALPGQPGNSVFNGHLETINAGRVFARLRELQEGDAVYVYTRTHRLDWVVREVRTVPNTDASFIRPTEDTRITLYTCAGRYNPIERDYTHRLVVVGDLVKVTPRS